MKILKQIMEKKIELSQEFMLNRQYLRGIWQFYCVYNLSLSILGMPPRNVKQKNKLWKRWLLSGKFDEKKFKKIKEYMDEDMKIIVLALKLINKQVDENPYEMGNFDKPDVVGCLSYEFPS